MNGDQEPRRAAAMGWVLGIAVAVSLASSPALFGGWIYDDWAMARSPFMQRWADVPLAFTRSSADYLGLSNRISVAGVTYRPLTMATLIATQAAFGTPFAHHLVSLALHLTIVLLSALTLRRVCAPALTIVCASTLALHPAGVEAYGWINGRSDLMAGLGLTMLALALSHANDARFMLIAFAGAAVSGLSKETGFVAVGFVTVAYAIPEDARSGLRGLRGSIPFACATLAGAFVALGVRALSVRLPDTTADGFLSDLRSPALVLRLLGSALDSVLIPAPRAMLGLAWDLSQALTTTRLVLILITLGAFALTLLKLKFRGAVLMAGAFAVILPCLTVRHAFWHGFDRYLYMPIIMLALAAGALCSGQRQGSLWSLPRKLALSGWLVVLFASTYITATSYNSQSAFADAMIERRPKDPTGYLILATELLNAGKRAEAARTLDRITAQSLPAGLALHEIAILRAAGLEAQELQIAEELDSRELDDAIELHGLVSVWLYHRELAKAFKTAERLRGHPVAFCRALVDLVNTHLARGTYNQAEAALARAFVAHPTCMARP